jgi:hypothetical protein
MQCRTASRRKRRSLLPLAGAALLGSFPSIVHAAPLRELCADRPGKDTPPCTVDAGRVMVEIGAAAFTHDESAGIQTSGSAFADVLARFGLTERSEFQLGFTPYAIIRRESRSTGQRTTTKGAGDMTAALKFNLRNPDGSGTSLAVQAFVTAPTGKEGIGSDDWEGGLIIPISFELSDKWGLSLDPEVDIRADEDGNGHHLALAGVVSLSRDLGGGVEASAEIWSMVDKDPRGDTTQASFDLSLAWTPRASPDLQIDAQVDLGLTSLTPDLAAAIGFAAHIAGADERFRSGNGILLRNASVNSPSTRMLQASSPVASAP